MPIELSPQPLNIPENHSKSRCLQPPTQDKSIDFSGADDMGKLQTSRPGFDTVNDDPVQWESWLSPEISWGNPSSHLSCPSDEIETVVSQQDMFLDKLQFEASSPAQPDEINHGKTHQPGLFLMKHSSLKPLLTSITAVQSLPSLSTPLPKSSMEESISQCKIQSESPKCTPQLLSDIFSSPGSNIGNETQTFEVLDPGDPITFSANGEGCKLARIASPTGVRKNTKKKRKVSPILDLEEAIEAEFLGRDSEVLFGCPILEGTDSISDLQGAPTVDDQVTNFDPVF